MKPTIKLTCETCSKVHNVTRTHEIPSHVISMGCNWCPECEDLAEGYYEEWYNDNEGGDHQVEELPDDPNQLVMPFMIDECVKKELANK